MKYASLILLLLALASCGKKITGETKAADSLRTIADSVRRADSLAQLSVQANPESWDGKVDFPLDHLVDFPDEESLVTEFGRRNVTVREGKVILFAGTEFEAAFEGPNGKFAQVTARTPSVWQTKEKLRLGMTMNDVAVLNEGGPAFHRKLGFSGPTGGKFDSHFMTFGFNVPDDIRNAPGDEWVSFKELTEKQKDDVKIGYIILYYDDQSVEEEEEPPVDTTQYD